MSNVSKVQISFNLLISEQLLINFNVNYFQKLEKIIKNESEYFSQIQKIIIRIKTAMRKRARITQITKGVHKSNVVARIIYKIRVFVNLFRKSENSSEINDKFKINLEYNSYWWWEFEFQLEIIKKYLLLK